VRRSWQHYAAPAAFLLAATVAVVLIRAGFESGGSPSASGNRGGSATVSKSTQRFWSVRAGDTFATIAAATGVSVSHIRKLNPGVVSTALFIGQRIRIR
jgi:LysM repeat protein